MYINICLYIVYTWSS